MPAHRWIVLGGVLLYLLSLALPAIDGSGFPALSGFDVLKQGAGGWRDGVYAWYANPVLIVAFGCGWLARFRLAFGAAVLGALLALSSFGAESAAASAGRSVPAFGFGPGFHLWLMAFALAMAAAVVGYIRSNSSQGAQK
jgi:hypothetical protein